MATIKEEQQVKLFPDEETTDNQSFLIDTDDECGPWVIVSNCGEELSMSLKNWDNLVELATKAKSKVNEQKEEK